MFFTMILFGKSYLFSKDYPVNFFESSGHINPEYFDKLQNESMRHLFQRALSPAQERITACEFLILARNVQANIINIHAPLIPIGESDWKSGSGGSGGSGGSVLFGGGGVLLIITFWLCGKS